MVELYCMITNVWQHLTAGHYWFWHASVHKERSTKKCFPSLVGGSLGIKNQRGICYSHKFTNAIWYRDVSYRDVYMFMTSKVCLWEFYTIFQDDPLYYCWFKSLYFLQVSLSWYTVSSSPQMYNSQKQNTVLIIVLLFWQFWYRITNNTIILVQNNTFCTRIYKLIYQLFVPV